MHIDMHIGNAAPVSLRAESVRVRVRSGNIQQSESLAVTRALCLLLLRVHLDAALLAGLGGVQRERPCYVRQLMN